MILNVSNVYVKDRTFIMNFFFRLFYIIMVIVPCSFGQKYHVCSSIKHIDACQQIDRSSDVRCVQHTNKVGCLLSIENGGTSFGRITAEEALLATNLTKNLAVIGEFISETNQRDTADYETVIIVRRNLTNGLKGLKGLKYCHPGMEIPNMTPYILTEFETKVLSYNQVDMCSAEVNTIIEKHIKALSEFYGPSCRPGKWVEDEELDKILKQKYSSLTQLCNTASYVTNSMKPYEQSLDCLTKGYGDVAITTLSAVNKFIDSNSDKLSSYRYLCPEDFVSPLDSSCSWTRQPWSLLVANKDIAPTLSKEIRGWFSDQLIETAPATPRIEKLYVPHLKSLLEFSETVKLNVTTVQSLEDYMKSFRPVPNLDGSKLCKTEMKWCVVSDNERRKCRWFSQASLNYGLQPVITCIRRPNLFECIEAVSNTGADIVTIDTDKSFPAARKNLSAIAFPVIMETEIVKILLIVASHIQKVEDLKDSGGCFPVYGGLAWLSFIDILKKTSCDYGEVLSNFVNESCVPGAREEKFGKTDRVDVDSLCHNCEGHPIGADTSSYCMADSSNMNYGNEGALRCFSNGVGIFTVITVTNGKLPSGNHSVLCRNGTRTTLENVDENCYLSKVTPSVVITRESDSMNENIRLALLEFDKHFARDLKTPFKLFEAFNGTTNLLFPESTQGLDTPNSTNDGITDYVNLFWRMKKCRLNEDLRDEGNNVRTRFHYVLIVVISFHILVVRIYTL